MERTIEEKQREALRTHRQVCELLEGMPTAFTRANLLIQTKDTPYYFEAQRLLEHLSRFEDEIRYLRDTAYTAMLEDCSDANS